jgi:tetratricopeptide (TPR) repeat protein
MPFRTLKSLTVFAFLSMSLPAAFPNEPAKSEPTPKGMSSTEIPREAMGDYAQAMKCIGDGQHEKALRLFDSILKQHPTCDQVRRDKAVLLMALRRNKEALEAILKLVGSNPNDDDAWRIAGAIHIQTGEHKKAIEAFSRSIALNKKEPSAYFDRAAVHLMEEKAELALRDYDKVLDLVPAYRHGHTMRGLAMYRLGRIKEALEECELAVFADLDDAKALALCGMCWYRMKNDEKARSYFEKAIRADASFKAMIDHEKKEIDTETKR